MAARELNQGFGYNYLQKHVAGVLSVGQVPIPKAGGSHTAVPAGLASSRTMRPARTVTRTAAETPLRAAVHGARKKDKKESCTLLVSPVFCNIQPRTILAAHTA